VESRVAEWRMEMTQATEAAEERILKLIEATQEMLSKLKDGVISGKPRDELTKLATDIAIAVTSLETLVDHRTDPGRK
jgi:hypothetical protein